MIRSITSKVSQAILAGVFTFSFTGLASAGGIGFPPDACGDQFTGHLVHFDKIVFRPRDGLKFACPAFSTDPSNKGTTVFTDQDTLDVKVLDDPFRVADVRAKAAQFLNFQSCFMVFGEIPVHKSHIVVIDVEYATACVGEPPLK